MTAVEASEAGYEIEKLLALHPKGFDLSLDRITRLLAALGNPQDRLPPVIHVAGTNGKGSATAFSRAILEAAGFSVHVHTSPHLVNWHERYRLGVKGGKEVTLTPGQTFYEGPDDVHTVGRNASTTQPAKFLVLLLKNKGAEALVVEE